MDEVVERQTQPARRGKLARGERRRFSFACRAWPRRRPPLVPFAKAGHQAACQPIVADELGGTLRRKGSARAPDPCLVHGHQRLELAQPLAWAQQIRRDEGHAVAAAHRLLDIAQCQSHGPATVPPAAAPRHAPRWCPPSPARTGSRGSPWAAVHVPTAARTHAGSPCRSRSPPRRNLVCPRPH